jgi:hypothetical protein
MACVVDLGIEAKTSQSFDAVAIVQAPQSAIALHGAWPVMVDFGRLF